MSNRLTERGWIMDIIKGAPRDLGEGLTVARILPQAAHRHVGPFVFFDHIGPVEFAPGKGIDVRPHPHIGLATITYLFEGEQDHRDSLGTRRTITPGAVNWMTAGSGIVHSERTGPKIRAAGHRMHGIQSWVGLPSDKEEVEPGFHHAPKETLPECEIGGVALRIIAGEAYGLTSPVPVYSPIFYLDARFSAGSRIDMPDNYEERAVFVVDGELEAAGQKAGTGEMVVFDPGEAAMVVAKAPVQAMLLGGAPLGHRHMYWNFVSSSKERIEQAKADWREGRFGTIPGDDEEFIPLPD